MIKLKETKNVVIYFVDSIGNIEIKKDYKYNELINYTVAKVRETDTTVTYRMPDDGVCTVAKELRLSVKEVIIRYYILKTFLNNNIYIDNKSYQFRKPNHIEINK